MPYITQTFNNPNVIHRAQQVDRLIDLRRLAEKGKRAAILDAIDTLINDTAPQPPLTRAQRLQIKQVIEKRPGITFKELASETDIEEADLRDLCAYSSKITAVKIEGANRMRIWFTGQVPEHWEPTISTEVPAADERELIERLLDFLEGKPGTAAYVIAKHLHQDKGETKKLLHKLTLLSLVKAEDHPTWKFYGKPVKVYKLGSAAYE